MTTTLLPPATGPTMRTHRPKIQLGRRLTPVLPASEDDALPVPGVKRDIVVRLARSRKDWEQALRLVACAYQARGYEPGQAEHHFTLYHALPDTVTLVAEHEKQIVATFTLIPDNVLLGIPLEKVYRTEVRALREKGHRLFETGCLAEKGLSLREFLQVFLTMMRLGWQHQLARGADTTVIAINPRHRDFYTKMHGFVPLGPRRSYTAVQGHPAEAYYLDPALMQVKAAQMHEYMFGTKVPSAALAAPRLSPELIRHFARRSDHADPRVVDEILDYVDACGSPRRW